MIEAHGTHALGRTIMSQRISVTRLEKLTTHLLEEVEVDAIALLLADEEVTLLESSRDCGDVHGRGIARCRGCRLVHLARFGDHGHSIGESSRTAGEFFFDGCNNAAKMNDMRGPSFISRDFGGASSCIHFVRERRPE